VSLFIAVYFIMNVRYRRGFPSSLSATEIKNPWCYNG